MTNLQELVETVVFNVEEKYPMEFKGTISEADLVFVFAKHLDQALLGSQKGGSATSPLVVIL